MWATRLQLAWCLVLAVCGAGICAGAPAYTFTHAQFPADWGATFFPRLSECRSRLIRVGVLGDSVSAGSCASNQYPNAAGRGYVQVLTNLFQSICDDGGSGLQSPSSNNRFVANGAYSDQQLPVHSEGFVHTPYRAGTLDAAYFASQAANSSLSFYVRGSNLAVYYLVGPSLGVFSITLDGALVASINCSTPGPLTQLRWSALAVRGEHRLLLTVLGEAEVDIVAVSGVNDAGVVVDNMSVPGVSLVEMWATNASVVGNTFVSSDGGAFDTAHLLVIMLGLNDAGIPEPWKSMGAAYSAAISAYQQAGVDDILLVISPGGMGAYHGNPTWESYRQLLPPLASDREVALLDFNNATVSDYPTLCSQGFFAYTPNAGESACTFPGQASLNLSTCNAGHPSDVGHSKMAQALFPWLSTPLYNTSSIVTITPRSNHTRTHWRQQAQMRAERSRLASAAQ